MLDARDKSRGLMETQIDLRLLAATYTYENSPVVLLYGKTAEGQPYEVQCRGFEPYFHIADPDPALLRHLSRDPEVIQVEPIRLTTSRGPEDCAQVVITKPWLTPSFRDRVKAWSKKKGRNEVLAADIPFAHRFIYDMDIGSTVRITGTVAPINENLFSVRASDFSDAPSFLPPLSILSFDIEASIKEGNIFVICTVFQDGEGNREVASFSKDDEADTLREFAEYVYEKDPDIITGYNTSGYDWPKLDE
ncbi:MAG: 3'-5' exonuclease, partial [Thermoplasmata archaeon]